ncbi:MAG: penicillin-binding protein 1C [Desulfomonile sp.]|nr:penicillin-binding protein 1C [Desulfomonile sp.]
MINPKKHPFASVPSMRRLGAFAALLVVLVGSAVGVSLLLVSLPDYGAALQRYRESAGTLVTDRNGRPLRLLPDTHGDFRIWTGIDRVPERVRHAFLAAEDKRFLYHPGFDPIAIVRAAATNLSRGRTVSGASTITQQVVRLITPRPRTWRAKVVELCKSVKMELQLTKDEILELYLNLSPMGGNMRGVGIAARTYFGKEVERLTSAEAAILAVIPRSPSRCDLRRPEGIRIATAERDRLFARMADLGWIDRGGLTYAPASRVKVETRPTALEAPHFVDFVLGRRPSSRGELRTSLDLDLQHFAERTLASHRTRLAGSDVRQAGLLVVSVPDGEILAMVGSFGYGARDQGYNNAVLAMRGAGSTLKPFLYGLALERGLDASTEIPDTFRTYPTPYGEYLPFNADRRSYGPVTIRSALGNSLNLAAVKTINSVGVDQFHSFLRQIDIVDDRMAPADHYGLGLAIGNVEVSLYRLVQAYAALARNGLYRPLTAFSGEGTPATRVFAPEVAYVISHILSDSSARLLTFGNPGFFDFPVPVAVKTGTSSRYRDGWVIGYTPRHVIGVWVGNFNGTPNRGSPGAGLCGPILKEIVEHLYRSDSPGTFARPPAVQEDHICWMSGKPAGPHCPKVTRELFIGDPATASRCDLPHESEHFHELSPAYARWLYRREAEQGVGRFRLSTVGASMSADFSISGASRLVRHAMRPPEKQPGIHILSPHERDRFVLAPHAEVRVRFHAVVQPVVPYVIWLVDGMEIARTALPYEFFWKPLRGRHTVHALTPTNEAAQVQIHVE